MAGKRQPRKSYEKRDTTNAGLRAVSLTRLKNFWQLSNEDGEWEPETEPIITPMLKMVDGGIEHCITALKSHDDDDARTFLEIWDQCTATDKKVLTIEEISHAAGIGSLRLAEVIQTALFLYGNMQTQMMMAAGLPQIVAVSIKQAKTKKGLADREWMLKAGKILPTPKGSQVAIQNNFGEGKSERELPEGTHEWKYPEDRLKEITAITNPKQLTAGHVAVEDGLHLSQNKTMVFER